MAAIKAIYEYLDTKAPFSFQMDFDNAGFLVGWETAEAIRVLVALDITGEVVEEAKERGCQLIVAHHPIIFHPVKRITDADPTGQVLLALIENHIGAICAHTNLDAAAGGVNDALAQALELKEVRLLHKDGWDAGGNPYGIGRIGEIEGFDDARSFACFVREKLNAGGLRLEDAGKPVRYVAVGGGACGDMLEEVVRQGCDTFVTADIKYNVFLDAHSMGINLIDAGHFPTENVVCPILVTWLQERFPELEVLQSVRHKEVFFSL